MTSALIEIALIGDAMYHIFGIDDTFIQGKPLNFMFQNIFFGCFRDIEVWFLENIFRKEISVGT